jgi:two-component system chemotaxis sensor kinase CheA
MNAFIEQFLLESREHVEQATTDLLALEKDPGDKALLDGVFRAFHTLKGSAGIIDFTAMGTRCTLRRTPWRRSGRVRA